MVNHRETLTVTEDTRLVGSSTAQRTFSGMHDKALVRPLGARPLSVAIDGCAEEVGAWVDARRVDVVVLCKVAHVFWVG